MSPPRSSPSSERATRVGDLHPDIERFALDSLERQEHARAADEDARLERMLTYLGRLIDLDQHRRILMVGCGPAPTPIRVLAERGFKVTGLDVEESFVAAAQLLVGDLATIVAAPAEAIPADDGSFDIVWCESVLEHVDAPHRALAELFRVTAPGGVTIISTTNRLAFSPTGDNGEFAVRFFNWLPGVVRESYVFEHLHRRPDLAHFTPRPAVHWFTFARLCALGRDAGFAHFFGLVDLISADDPSVRGSRFRQLALRLIRSSPWLRALALTQTGGTIIMRRRGA